VNEPFKKRRGRIGALTVVLAALFLLIAFRLAALVVFDGPRLTSLAHTEHTGEIALAAPRGPLADRNGEPLALSAETRSVYARPAQLTAATRTVLTRNGKLLVDNAVNNTFQAKINQRNVWVRVTDVDGKVTEVSVLARTSMGDDVDLSAELSKQIALQLMVSP